MGHMPPNCFSTIGVEMQKTNTILKVEHDFEQYAHILKKKG
jgi:hypothetical protein